MSCCVGKLLFFFFNDTATTEIYTLSLHDALPISHQLGEPQPAEIGVGPDQAQIADVHRRARRRCGFGHGDRSEEHTSELQSRLHLVCRLLLEKKKTTNCSGLTRPCNRRRAHVTLA